MQIPSLHREENLEIKCRTYHPDQSDIIRQKPLFYDNFFSVLDWEKPVFSIGLWETGGHKHTLFEVQIQIEIIR